MLRGEFDLSDITVRFLIGPRGEVQHIRRAGACIVAEPDPPQPVDDESFPILPQCSLMMKLSFAIQTVGVDFAVAKVTDDSVVYRGGNPVSKCG